MELPANLMERTLALTIVLLADTIVERYGWPIMLAIAVFLFATFH